MLTACGSGIVRSGDGSLEASAVTPSGAYTFRCHPVGEAGLPVVIREDMSFSCDSTDQKANLTIFIKTITDAAESKSTSRTVLSAVLLVYGPPALNYGGVGRLDGIDYLIKRRANGGFTANIMKGVMIKGSYRFSSKE